MIGNGEPTLEDVARAAGVSRSTVSRVVNGAGPVSPASLAAVQAAIAELGYRPNLAARALVTRRVGAVVVLVPETDERFFSDPFFPLAYHGALEAFSDSDTHVLLSMAHPDAGVEPMLAFFLSNRVDGAIVLSHHGDAFPRAVATANRPVVFVGDPQVPGLPFVDIDHVAAAGTATDHLVERGAQVIGSVSGPMDMHAGVDRLRGFQEAMGRHGRNPDLVAEGDFTLEGGERAAYQLLSEHPEVDGLFVASDLMAMGALRAAAQLGRTVPDDLRVVGFDDSRIARATLPELTTMENNPELLARTAGEMLQRILAGEVVESPTILPSRLVVRGSA